MGQIWSGRVTLSKTVNGSDRVWKDKIRSAGISDNSACRDNGGFLLNNQELNTDNKRSIYKPGVAQCNAL